MHGRVDLSSLPAETAGLPLRAALVWGAVPNYVLACLKFPFDPNLFPVCPDPFGFVPGQVEADVEVGADGGFTLPVRRLPDASLSVGDQSARIAWGSVIVAADSDGNGAFDLLVGTGDHHDPAMLADRAVAASFFTLHEPQQRLAFREGGYDTESRFYPAPGCDAPPTGFSVLTTPGLKDLSLDPAPGECTSAKLEDAVVLATPLDAVDAKGLACRTLNRAPIRQPEAESPDSEGEEGRGLQGKQVCLDAQTLAVIGEGDCPIITVMPLAGCRDNLVCAKPDWDLTQQPPAWWPCE